MSRQRAMIGVAAAMVFLLIFFSKGEAKPPRHIEACQAIANAGRFNGSYLSIIGHVESDGIEHTDLTGRGCSKGIALSPSKAAYHDPGYKTVRAVVGCPPLGMRRKKMSGTFTGRFVWKPGQIPEWRLRLDRVSNLSIRVEGCGLGDSTKH